MLEKDNILDAIYKDLKKRRIVLTLDEYAKAIGISRATLFRLRDEPENISSELIERAKSLFDTKIVSRETDQLIKAPPGRFPKKTKPGELIDFYDTDFAAGEIEFYDDNNTIAPHSSVHFYCHRIVILF